MAIFLPCIFGVVMWDKLPLSLAIHFSADGVADGTGSKAFAVFGIPAILFVLHWVCVLVTLWDWKKKGEQSGKVFGLVLWICPFISAFTAVMLYSVALGTKLNMTVFMLVMLGLLFAVMGNYMPKVKRNGTMGVKVKWALTNDENWYATPRVAGKAWTFGGLIMMLLAFLPTQIALTASFVLIIPIAVIPAVYSYVFYRKQLREGKVQPAPKSKYSALRTAIILVVIAALAVAAYILLFTGDITYEVGEDSFAVTASYYEDITVKYEDVDSVEYRDDFDKGSRIAGFGSPRLSMGNFENEEFGAYAIYSYNCCDSAIVLRDGDKVLVLNGKDEAATKELYNELEKRIQK